MKYIQLYDYQEEMKKRIEMSFKTHQSVMVQMPTGTGKTYLLADIVREEGCRVKNPCVWIVAHRRELVEQIVNAVVKILGGADEQTSVDVSSFLSEQHIKVMSIQWLSRHYRQLEEIPTLIVIDEAHHAVAKSYADVMDAYPEAKKLGVTATPCRLTKCGFTALFDELLQSWTNKRFIAEGRLSLYDYMSVKEESKDQQIVYSLKKRGADGDYSLKEMSEKLDVKPSIERLCDTVLRYARGKKGITYAIDIAHAEHIAEKYRECGIDAVAISSRTPVNERIAIIERFKRGSIRVLVNVDLFGEGFDCPDVEFIQLARPTLSLAKYLQQVGRGMRLFEGKEYCLILDNVGLYRLFGLPSDEHDWQTMFKGELPGKGDLSMAEKQYGMACSARSKAQSITLDTQTELITVMTHDGQQKELDEAFGYEVFRNDDGKAGVMDKCGNEVLPCIYDKVELFEYGYARLYSRRKNDREYPWIDLRNGVRFAKRPYAEKHGFLEFSTVDAIRLYPRVRTHLMDMDSFVTKADLIHGINDGLRFRTFYIQPVEPDKLYQYKDKWDDVVLFEDESNNYYCRKGLEASLQEITLEEWNDKRDEWQKQALDFQKKVDELLPKMQFKHKIRSNVIDRQPMRNAEEKITVKIVHKKGTNIYAAYYRPLGMQKWQNRGSFTYISRPEYGIRILKDWNGKYLLRNEQFDKFEDEEVKYDYAELLDYGFIYLVEKGKGYWLDLVTCLCHYNKPELISLDGWKFLKEDDMYFACQIRMLNGYRPYRRDEIKAYDDVCFLGSKVIIVSGAYPTFFIRLRHADGKRFVVGTAEKGSSYEPLYDLYYDGLNPPIIKKRNFLVD